MGSEFAEDYFAARFAFRAAAKHCGLKLSAHAIDASGPGGEQLTIDVAVQPAKDVQATLILSSGLHGVEGFFGSAVQRMAIPQLQAQSPIGSRVQVVYLHALNPFGFAWRRRVNEDNADLNRNFLLPDQQYEGAPPGYAALNSLLNPDTPPQCCDLFMLRTAVKVIRQGRAAVKQSVAGGQYEYPSGLFYGGAALCQTGHILARILPDLIGGTRRVLHLDYHTGLGRWATCKLLLERQLDEDEHAWLTSAWPAAMIEENDATGVAYRTRGGIGLWCESLVPGVRYTHLCAEFGTYPPLRVVRGLRAENRAWHACGPQDPRRGRAAWQLTELFCPQSESWRTTCVRQGAELAIAGRELLGGDYRIGRFDDR